MNAMIEKRLGFFSPMPVGRSRRRDNHLHDEGIQGESWRQMQDLPHRDPTSLAGYPSLTVRNNAAHRHGSRTDSPTSDSHRPMNEQSTPIIIMTTAPITPADRFSSSGASRTCATMIARRATKTNFDNHLAA